MDLDWFWNEVCPNIRDNFGMFETDANDTTWVHDRCFLHKSIRRFGGWWAEEMPMKLLFFPA